MEKKHKPLSKTIIISLANIALLIFLGFIGLGKNSSSSDVYSALLILAIMLLLSIIAVIIGLKEGSNVKAKNLGLGINVTFLILFAILFYLFLGG